MQSVTDKKSYFCLPENGDDFANKATKFLFVSVSSTYTDPFNPLQILPAVLVVQPSVLGKNIIAWFWQMLE